MSLKSAIYEGEVRHRRMQPRAHEFTFPLFMVYLDLAEMDRVFSMTRLWSASRPAPARFRRSDYYGQAGSSLDQSVRDRVEHELGFRPNGPVRLLTHLRYFGMCFNPVSFYYCFDQEDRRVDAIVAEITNTPWKERHTYVLDPRTSRTSGTHLRWSFAKNFHVSPFMQMEIDYDWAFSEPGPDLFVHMNLAPSGRPATAAPHTSGSPTHPPKVFDATLRMQRHELTPSRMRSQLVRFPFMTASVVARIHFEALRLWLKGCPVHPHPPQATGPALSSAPSHALPDGVSP